MAYDPCVHCDRAAHRYVPRYVRGRRQLVGLCREHLAEWRDQDAPPTPGTGFEAFLRGWHRAAKGGAL